MCISDLSLENNWTWPQGYKYKTFFVLNPTEHGIQMLIKSKMLKNKDLSCFQMLRCCIYHAHKYQDANIYEHDKFHAQLS